jgi:hypothetical protein
MGYRRDDEDEGGYGGILDREDHALKDAPKTRWRQPDYGNRVIIGISTHCHRAGLRLR